MLVLVCVAHLWFCFVLLHIPFKGKERPTKTKLMPAKLRAVLPTFGFSEMSFTDSLQC